MIIKIIKNIRHYFREIYLFESKKNKNNISFKNFKPLKYSKFESIKEKNLINFIKSGKKKKRFNYKHNLFALFI